MNRSTVMKSIHENALFAALVLAATVSAPAVAEDAGPEPFTMAVIVDAAYGRKVTLGHYDQAISRITKGGHRSIRRFEDQVNLCVAYVKTSAIQKAGAVCDAAIDNVKSREPRVSRLYADRSLEARAYRADLALALSNRGVLLAATGDTKSAKQDFLAALELRTDLTPIVENNLERLIQNTGS